MIASGDEGLALRADADAASRWNAGFESKRKSSAATRPVTSPASDAAERDEQRGDERRDRAGRRRPRPRRRGQTARMTRVGVVDRRRLLIPGVAVGKLTGENALADVRVESLVGAHRLHQRRQAHDEQDACERQEQPFVMQSRSA